MAAVETPHLKWPFRVAVGRFQVVEQDTIDDVVQCVHVLLNTPLGFRPLAPDVGVIDGLWRSRFETDRLVADLGEWEPRGEITADTAGVDGAGEQSVNVNVDLAEA